MTDTQGQYERVFDVYWPVGVGVFAIIALTLGFLLIRYRSREDRFDGGTDSRRGLEIGYAFLLALIAAGLVWLTFDANDEIQAKFDEPAELAIDVTAARWNWRFTYPDGVVEQGAPDRIPVLRVPAGQPVDFDGISLDIVHSFWIPDERFKRDLFPGRRTGWQMTFEEVGFEEAGGKCAEFCGLFHADMRFNLEVMEPAEFEAWLAAEQELTTPEADPGPPLPGSGPAGEPTDRGPTSAPEGTP